MNLEQRKTQTVEPDQKQTETLDASITADGPYYAALRMATIPMGAAMEARGLQFLGP